MNACVSATALPDDETSESACVLAFWLSYCKRFCTCDSSILTIEGAFTKETGLIAIPLMIKLL